MLSDSTIIRDGANSLPRRALLRLRQETSVLFRDKLNENIRNKLENVPEFTIFSNNCLGGVFYHDAGRRFTSPLINTAMDGTDFLKFVADPKRYLDSEMEFFTWPGRNFPIARIDDIEVNFVHYHTPEECREIWSRRAKRIVWDNVFVIATDHDGMYKPECMELFDTLPYNKIMFTANEFPQYGWAIPIKQFKGRNNCRVTTSFADVRGHRYYETAFDIAGWIRDNSQRS